MRFNVQNIKKDNKIYGNCQILSPEGILMFRCNEKKATWYLKRNLGIIINDKPLIIKLTFEQNGLGNHDKEYGLGIMENKCVCCGSLENLTRHHIVPHGYRRYFPENIKSHNFHDVLPICIYCHEIYERKADELKKELAIKYDAPLNGEVEINKNNIKYTKIASALLNSKIFNIPRKRSNGLKSDIKHYFNIRRLTKKRLEKISEMEIVRFKRSHGEIVVSNITNIQEFTEMWREHFLENMDCKYLPENWNLKYE